MSDAADRTRRPSGPSADDEAPDGLPASHEARLAQVLDRSPDFVGTSDLRGRVLSINPAGLRMLGYPEDHPVRQTSIPDYLPVWALEDLKRVALSSALKDGTWRGETSMRHLSGHVLPVSMLVMAHLGPNGTTAFLSTVARDITEEKRVAKALAESTARFEVIARATSDAVWDYDVVAQRILWNESVGTIFGYDLGSISDDFGWWADKVHPEDRKRVVDGLDDALALKTSWQCEYRFLKANGRWAQVLDRGVVLLNEAGEAHRMIGAMSDLTERKEMHARLMLSDRMASLGTLAAGVAHEINNPLAYVLSNLTYLEDALSLSVQPWSELQRGRLRQTVADARHGAERVREIVRDLKTFSRAGDETRAPVDVQRVLESAINLVKSEVSPRAKLVREYREVPPVLANEGRLCQVFVNLLVNAAQAIADGKPLENELRVVTRLPSSGQVVIEICDTGSGIPPEALSRIFDPFFTTKPVGVGTGLGLSVCHGIVSALGGEILVSSKVGAGTTFSVFLPAAPVQAVTDQTLPPLEPKGTLRRRVLIVDDERNFLMSLKLLLQHEHEVATASTAEEALARFDGGERFDLVLCDLMMPGMTGMDLYEVLRAREPLIAERIIFLTGGAFTARSRQFLDSCKNLHLEKPLDFQRLKSLIQRCVAWSEPRADFVT